MALAVTLLALALIFLGLSVVVLNGIGARSASTEYALFIDAGSSGSRIHLYEWQPDDQGPIPVIREIPLDDKCDDIDGGLSTLGEDKDEMATTIRVWLALLTTCAKLGLKGRVEDIEAIPLYLLATAGMRLLKSKNGSLHDKIMRLVHAHLEDAPFDLRDASTIDARVEALYAWVAANHLNGTLGMAAPDGTIGILELGGASAQIAFVPIGSNDSKPEDTEVVHVANRQFWVYARGYDGVGKEEFIDEFKDDVSCFPKNNKDVVVGDYHGCKNLISEHLDESSQDGFKRLRDDAPPDYEGDFLAISNFYHTPSFFGQHDVLDYGKLKSAGSDYCGKEWEAILEEYSDVRERFLEEYCLMAAYIPTLLTRGFHVEDDNGRLMFRLKGNKPGVDWTLGALILLLH